MAVDVFGPPVLPIAKEAPSLEPLVEPFSALLQPRPRLADELLRVDLLDRVADLFPKATQVERECFALAPFELERFRLPALFAVLRFRARARVAVRRARLRRTARRAFRLEGRNQGLRLRGGDLPLL